MHGDKDINTLCLSSCMPRYTYVSLEGGVWAMTPNQYEDYLLHAIAHDGSANPNEFGRHLGTEIHGKQGEWNKRWYDEYMMGNLILPMDWDGEECKAELEKWVKHKREKFTKRPVREKVKGAIVEIPPGSGNRYRYIYEGGKTIYKGPVGDSPQLTEEEFLKRMKVGSGRDRRA